MIEVRTARGWKPLGSSEHATPSVTESGRLRIRGLPTGCSLDAGGLVLEVGSGVLDLHLPSSELAGHVGHLRLGVMRDGFVVDEGDLEIVPDKLSQEQFVRLRADLERTWTGLILDPSGPTHAPAKVPQPKETAVVDVWRLAGPAAVSISIAPVGRLRLQKTQVRIGRAGRVDVGARRELLLAAKGGRPVPALATTLDVDTPENRMVAELLERLERVGRRSESPSDNRVALLASSCRRRRGFRTIAAEPLRTPTFLTRSDPRYRQVYEALRRLGEPAAARTEGPEELRLGIASLPRLYEYWVFLKVVEALTKRMGPPRSPGTAVLGRVLRSNKVRLDLEPNTTIEFPGEVRVVFTPTISATGRSWRGLELVPLSGQRSALLATPDVVVEGPRGLLVIDAKYVAHRLVDSEAARTHAKYARIRRPGSTGLVRRVVVAHPHADLNLAWAGYTAMAFVPGPGTPDPGLDLVV